MKILPPILGLLVFPLVAFGKDTAYQALRALGAARDKSVLNQVIEVKGYRGTPQPDSWIILLDDPSARGGVREVEISNGKVISERTPMNSTGVSPAINFHKLNLDSTGAFSLADQTARSSRVGFDAVNYTLRRDQVSEGSVWVLELFDARNRSLGTVTLSAENGTLVANNLHREGIVEESFDNPEETPVEPEGRERRGFKKKVKTTVKGTAKEVGGAINRAFHKVGDHLKSFFDDKD